MSLVVPMHVSTIKGNENMSYCVMHSTCVYVRCISCVSCKNTISSWLKSNLWFHSSAIKPDWLVALDDQVSMYWVLNLTQLYITVQPMYQKMSTIFYFEHVCYWTTNVGIQLFFRSKFNFCARFHLVLHTGYGM